VKTSRVRTPSSPAFARLCADLAGEWAVGGWSVSRNGTIIEQQQIFTTHNLAVAFDSLDLTTTLRPRLRELAERYFQVGI